MVLVRIITYVFLDVVDFFAIVFLPMYFIDVFLLWCFRDVFLGCFLLSECNYFIENVS